MGWTNRGRARLAEAFFQNAWNGGALPTNLYVALVTSAVAPTADTNTLGELTEIAAGNGYTSGGYQLSRNSSDFDVLTEDDANDKAILQIKDVSWTASGGTLPTSGSGARYAVLTDDNATVANREVLAFFDLTSDRSVEDQDKLTLVDLELDLA